MRLFILSLVLSLSSVINHAPDDIYELVDTAYSEEQLGTPYPTSIGSYNPSVFDDTNEGSTPHAQTASADQDWSLKPTKRCQLVDSNQKGRWPIRIRCRRAKKAVIPTTPDSPTTPPMGQVQSADSAAPPAYAVPLNREYMEVVCTSTPTDGLRAPPSVEHPRSSAITVPIAYAGAIFVLGFLVGWLAGCPGQGPTTVDRAIDAPGRTGPTTVDRAIQCAGVESTATEESAIERTTATEDSAIESTDDVADAAVEAANIEAADEPPPRPETGVAGPSGRLAAAAEAVGSPLGLATTVDGGGEASFDDTHQQRDDTGAQQLPLHADDGDDELGCKEQREDGGSQYLPPPADDDGDDELGCKEQREDGGSQYLPHQADDDGDDELGCKEQREDGGSQYLPPPADDDGDDELGCKEQRKDGGSQYLPHQADDDGDDELGCEEQRKDGGSQYLPHQADDDDDGDDELYSDAHDAVPSYIRGWRTHPGEPDD
ncbi:hypothetical protein FBU31_003143, partial [Coemansia sp. 'formosensis']